MTFLAKIFDNVYKHHTVICISILILRIGLRLVDIFISMMSFLSAKEFKKGYTEMAIKFITFCISILRIRLVGLNDYFYDVFL